jgi:hypothetical protein
MKDLITILLSIFALLISSATFIYARIQERRVARESIIKALQGEKEAVAYIAFKVQSERWPSRDKKPEKKGAVARIADTVRSRLGRSREEKFRKDVITALCLAWSLEGADRPKALIFEALKKIIERGYEPEVTTILQDVLRQYNTYQTSFSPSEFVERILAVKSLMKVLKIEEVPSTDSRQILTGGGE